MNAIDRWNTPRRSVLVHQVAWLGSDESLAVCKHLILNKLLSSQDAITLISSLSMFLRTPTDYVLGQLLVSPPSGHDDRWVMIPFRST